MVKIGELVEAFQAGKFPEISSQDFQKAYEKLLLASTKLADVRTNYALCKYRDIYMLAKSDNTIVGILTLSPTLVAGKNYFEVKGIYIPVEYRKSPALYWLLYSVKEKVDKDVIADGAIFDDGQALVNAIQKHNMFYVADLNKETGEITKVTNLISSIHHCYLFRTTELGFGEQIFTEGLGFTWYPLFGEIEE